MSHNGSSPVLQSDQEGDPDILQSPNDPKKYRYIELRNGLRALLISDMTRRNEEEEEEEEEKEEEQEEEEEEEEGEGTVKTRRKSKNQAAAALCVSVGSFSDPSDLPGLAHFLEHMVFMGSEKFPEENGFDAFLKRHGGNDNASTDCERTVFIFDVHWRHFRDALDRWAQFFICPLMLEDTADREVEAVDSEFQLARPDDSHRQEKLLGSLATAGHPMTKFFWGNAQTLKKPDTYRRLRVFWERFYSAHFMTLAVQSRETLDTLERWVTEIFSDVPNNGDRRPDFSHLQQPFNTPAFHKLYRVVPVRNVHALTITWTVPPQEQHYQVKPLHYLSCLMGHEGPGSILSLLRRKCWALALCGGGTGTGFDHNSTCSIFSISITLTEQGLLHFYQVVHLVFQYVKMLQVLGPQQRFYEEIQKIAANEFQYQEQTDPVDFVQSVCENMQLFPKRHFLSGDQLLLDCDHQVISAVLTLLTPQRANLLLTSPQNQSVCDLTEPWFGTCYTCEDIPVEWAQRWADVELTSDLHLPEENHFIATDFSLKESDCPDSEVPVTVEQSEHGRLWFKKDTRFKSPRGYICFHLISPLIQQSPTSLVLLDLLVNLLAQNLAEEAYGALLAQLDYRLVAGQHGLMLQLGGFSHKLPLLLRLVVDHLVTFQTEPETFNMFTEQLKKVYYNCVINPQRLARDVRLLILEPARWAVTQKYEAVCSGTSVQQFLSFVTEFKSKLYIEGLVQGNFSCLESREFLLYFTERLQSHPLPAEVHVQFQVVELPAKHHMCKIRSLNEGDANSEVTVYYQSGLGSIREHALMELMVSHMEQPCFHFLRTTHTLGYQVYPACRTTSGVLGFSVTVETQATKFSSDLVEEKVEQFLQSFGDSLEALSEDSFSTQVTALIQLKQDPDAHLGQEVDRHWSEVATQQYVFDRLYREVEALKTFTKEDLDCWFKKQRASSRKLSVHVVGFGPEEDSANRSAAEGRSPASCQMGFLSVSLCDAALITDIKDFNSKLRLLPYHKILS